MADLFLFLFFITLIGLIVGLAKPSIFTHIVKRELTRKQIGLFFGGALVLFFVLTGITAERKEPAPTPTPATEQERVEIIPEVEDKVEADKPEPETTNQVKKEPKPTPTPEPKATIGEKNALRKAKSYLDYTAFSRDGLIAQLEYEGFTRQQAEYGTQAVGY